MKGDLLWVYEGLTEYLGEVLAPRSGLWTAEQFRDSAGADRRPISITNTGARWRPLEDTAVAAQLLYSARLDDYATTGAGWTTIRRATLIWLEADVLDSPDEQGREIAERFCQAVSWRGERQPEMKTYTFEDVVAGLNAVQPYDWTGFFNQRLHSTSPHAPMGGVEGAGWKLVYDDNRSDFQKAAEEVAKSSDFWYSLGFQVRDDDGTISDVMIDSPAYKAGMSPSTKLIAVNGRQASGSVLREALRANVTGSKPIELLVKNGEYYKSYSIDYRVGERYPHLVRNEQPDLLTQITSPVSK